MGRILDLSQPTILPKVPGSHPGADVGCRPGAEERLLRDRVRRAGFVVERTGSHGSGRVESEGGRDRDGVQRLQCRKGGQGADFRARCHPSHSIATSPMPRTRRPNQETGPCPPGSRNRPTADRQAEKNSTIGDAPDSERAGIPALRQAAMSRPKSSDSWIRSRSLSAKSRRLRVSKGFMG